MTMFTVAFSLLCIGTVMGCGLPPSLCYVDHLELSTTLECDAVLDKQETSGAPTVKYSSAEPNKYYSLIMVDPDAPNPQNPTQKYWLHWLVTDIQGSGIKDGTVIGNVKMAYNGPSPPTGVHRYQFLLLEQSALGSVYEDVPSTRGKFQLEQFMTDNGLCDVKAAFQYKVEA